jgi:chromosome segregation ATPase
MLRRGTGRSPYADTEERLQRALQENAQLKSQKNDLEEKLKKVQTQFRRLAADWRQAQEGHSGHATPSSAHLTRGGPPPLPSSSSSLVAPASARPNSAGAAVALSPATAAAASSSSARNVLPSLPTNQRGAGSRSPSITATPVKHASASISRTGDHNPNLAVGPARAVSEAELAACKAALAHAQLEVQQLRSAVAQAQAQAQMAATAAAANTSASTDASALAAAQAEAAGLRTQLQQVREELNKSLFTQQQLQTQGSQLPEGLLRQMQGGNAAQQQQQQLETQLRASIDTLTREKQELSLKLRLMEVDKQALESAAAVAAAGHNGSPDPADVDAVQAELHRKATEVTLLNSRLQYAQGQVETLRGECGRLVEELKQATTAHGDTKKALFALEHEAAALRAKASTLDEVEAALQKKNEENAHLEEELLKLVGSLQSCNRETEAAVRLEFQARLREVQEMRDTAERERRETERNLLNTQHDLAELRRTLESVQEDLLLYKGQVAKVEKEKSALSAQIAFAGHSSAAVGAVGAALTDEDVHRALAVAAMKKRGGSSLSMLDAVLGGASSTDSIRTNVDQNKAGAAADATAGEAHEAKEALDLYEALTWDGNWELGQLREALATAAMDLELAETRCQQMAEQVEQYRTSLHQISEERDVLLEEGIALRGRVTHVQTIFAKQQLQAYRAAARGGSSSDSSGLIAFSIRGLRSHEAAMCRALGIADLHAPVSFFFTLDGLAEYETMMGPTLHALSDVVDVRFQYDDLAKDAVTLAVVEHTVFTFQLHCVCGDESRLVAMAELPGVALLAARELPREETLSLVDGAGETVGAIFIEFCCTRLMLPVLLDAPLSDPKAASVTLSAAEIKSAMVALRTVRFLRIQVFDANGLAGSAEDNTLPQPYVFYTASSPLGGLNCVRDTVVQPINKVFTTDPKFDVAPVDHRVVVDPSLIRFIAFGTVCFVVFDERAKEVQMNLGIVEVALRPLLESPVATIITTQPLHPQGTLRVGLSWVSGA